MISNVSERTARLIRWVFALSWIVLIVSLFFDPITPWVTQADNILSPFKIDPSRCIYIQGVCHRETPYEFGAQLFWGGGIPLIIFILLVFGHDFWRRLCPLSFFSQIPNALGIQRTVKKSLGKKIRKDIVLIKKDSWLGRNYLYLQFFFLYTGLCIRILFVNSNRIALASYLIFTIFSAIAIGFLYGGKSWCNYFCPMAPVQKVYGEPRGLLAKPAFQSATTITQSMCRTVEPTGEEKSVCVACQSPCIDIDAEKSYWDGVTKPDRKFMYYAYFGLAVGNFLYYYLYSGNWGYYLSGYWTHEEGQLASLFDPGYYIFGTPIGIPKIVAVPLTLGFFSIVSYYLGKVIEKKYKAYLYRRRQFISQENLQHRLYTVSTYVVFNYFFIFGGRYYIDVMPIQLQFLTELLIVLFSTFWCYRTWRRDYDVYSAENALASSRKQLARLDLNVTEYLSNRYSVEDLHPHEAFVLAKILPGFIKKMTAAKKPDKKSVGIK